MFNLRTNLRHAAILGGILGITLPVAAIDVDTTASAGSNGRGSGNAAATANMDGDGIGFVRTKADTGKINFARGLAVGFDEDGLSVSNSFALAPRIGPAVGGTFNLHIGMDGQATVSTGRVTADGDRNRSVTAGGSAGSNGSSPFASATASGDTGPRGEVRAETHSSSRPAYRSSERSAYRAPTQGFRASTVNWR